MGEGATEIRHMFAKGKVLLRFRQEFKTVGDFVDRPESGFAQSHLIFDVFTTEDCKGCWVRQA